MEEHFEKKYTIFFVLAFILFIIGLIIVIVGVTSNSTMWVGGIITFGGSIAFLFSGIKVYSDKKRLFGETNKGNIDNNKPTPKQLAQHIRRDAFRYYILGSVFEMNYVKHERFSDENIKEGFYWAVKIIDEAYDSILNMDMYDRKGKLNIYPDQELYPFNGLILDLFEVLIFGKYSDYNVVEEIPEYLVSTMKIKLRTAYYIFDGTLPPEMIIGYSYSFQEMKKNIFE